MAEYTPSYMKPYTEGFVNAPPYDTPITAEVLNAIDNAISAIEQYLRNNPIPTADESSGSGTDVNLENLVVTKSFTLGTRAEGDVGNYSVALGSNNVASSYCAVAIGEQCKATTYDDVALGEECEASGGASLAAGYRSKAKALAAIALGASSIAEQYYAVAIGYGCKASGSNVSVAIGNQCEASGYGAVSIGQYNKSTGSGSFAEGKNTESAGEAAHTEGYYAKANANYSHAEGNNTIASGQSQHVEGKYNIEDTENKYVHIVGNGGYNTETSQYERSNAHTLDWEGNAWYAGTVESKDIILTDTEDSTKRYLIQVTNGQLVATEITATA